LSRLEVGAGDWEQSDCAKDVRMRVHPRKGDAILFYSLQSDNQLDPTSLHGGCPVVAGEKWSATKWMRVGKYMDP
jgi:prolyl 4-hydroxylase